MSKKMTTNLKQNGEYMKYIEKGLILLLKHLKFHTSLFSVPRLVMQK